MKEKKPVDMNKKKTGCEAAADLRRQAEEKALADETKATQSLSAEETRQVLHELRVHQIELEMQNEELRRAQAELEFARARYFDLYDLAPVGYVTLNEKGLIQEANLTAAALLGVARGALARQPLSRFISNEDQDIYYRHYKTLFETHEAQVCELRMVKNDGTIFCVRLEAVAARDADGTPVCRAVLSDITEQINIEAAFRHKAQDLQEKHDDLSRSTHAVAHGRQNPPKVIKGDSTIILLLEDDPAHAEAVQRAFLDSDMRAVVHWARNMRDYRTLADAYTPDIALVDLKLPDGNAVDVLSSPPETGLFPILIMTSYGNEQVAVESLKAGALDYVEKSPQAFAGMPHIVERALRKWNLLQERKQVEVSLQKSEENFRRSLDDSPLGVRVVSDNGETIYANRQLLDIYGYDNAEELNKIPLKERYTPQSYFEFERRRKARDRGAFGPSQYEIAIVRKNGEVRQLQVFRKAILWNGAKQFQALYRDITEEKKRGEILKQFEVTIQGQKLLLNQQSSSVEELIERLTRSKSDLEKSYETLKAKKDDLVRSEKLAFTGRMAAGIAHEIRNPLTNVILSIRQLKKDGKIKPDGFKYAEIVENNTNRIEYLITELLNCARPIKLNLQPWDIHLLINDILNVHKVRLKTQRIKVSKDLSAYPSVLLFDKEQLGRVLLNLVANAIDAMHAGGKLLIVTRKGENDFVIKIQDNGSGISENNLIKIFDPFFTTKKRGTGLGLSTCQNIVTSHGGMIEVESSWRKGSVFSVSLPLEPKRPDDAGDIKGNS